MTPAKARVWKVHLFFFFFFLSCMVILWFIFQAGGAEKYKYQEPKQQNKLDMKSFLTFLFLAVFGLFFDRWLIFF